MDYFLYKNNKLYAENVSIEQIASEINTPFYCYSRKTIDRHYNVFENVFKGLDKKICYAVKANSNHNVLKVLAQLGAGADVVSKGEIKKAIDAGISPDNIVFSGVGKTEEEIRYGLEAGIYQFNVESEEEVFDIEMQAKKLGKTANIAIRVNPNVKAETHAKITTGTYENKFGINYEDVKPLCEKISGLENINLQGLSIHIGSQITKLDSFEQAFIKIAELYRELKPLYNLSTLDFGGGLGVPYNSLGEAEHSSFMPEEYGAIVKRAVKGLECQVIFEPGRVIVGNAGVLVAKVIRVKRTSHKTFIIIDAGMNDLMRPSLYDAYHQIVTVDSSPRELINADIVGPVCETSDVFVKDYKILQVRKGDLIAFRTAGAYGAVMANEYNSRPMVKELMVDDDAVIL